ncbi:MAG: hypothetical protein ABI599_06530 [Flavobacteriales bacterium]
MMKKLTHALLVSTLLFAGCSKHECQDTAPGQQDLGATKIPHAFVAVIDGGAQVPGYAFNVHCGSGLSSDGSGQLIFGTTGCASLSQVSVGSYCFQRNTFYYLKPTVGGADRTFLKFKFDNTFDYNSLGLIFIRFEPSTMTWVVPSGVQGFESYIYDQRKALPVCQGVRQ